MVMPVGCAGKGDLFMKQIIFNPVTIKNGIVFNSATRCRICGRGLRSQPWASLRIGPQCAFRSGEHAGLVRMLRNTRSPGRFSVLEEPDPVTALAKIGMPPEQILQVDVPKLVIPVAEMGAAVKQMTAFDRLSKKSAAVHRVL
jgi:hypothetical protein